MSNIIQKNSFSGKIGGGTSSFCGYKMVKSGIILLILVTATMFLCGCGSKEKRTPGQGIVTMNNAPLEGAEVSFIPSDGKSEHEAHGVTDKEGKFTLKTLLGGGFAGVAPGEYKVVIQKTLMVDSGQKAVNPTDPSKKDPVMVAKNTLPVIYATPDKTPLTASVKENEKSDFKFNLEGTKK